MAMTARCNGNKRQRQNTNDEIKNVPNKRKMKKAEPKKDPFFSHPVGHKKYYFVVEGERQSSFLLL
jgi:hypothetical protein